MLNIDGSFGEGGGQILRTALALSVCTQQAFCINKIRSARKNPGLQPQHLAAVNAAAAISHASLHSVEKGSQELCFSPQNVEAGHYDFNIGTAGSTSLVFQTILPALALANNSSTITLEGGTHNPFAPPFIFLQQTFLPLLNKMGTKINATLERPGFARQGGGKVHFIIEPVNQLHPLELIQRGDLQQQRAEVLLANLPKHIAERELAVIHNALGYGKTQLHLKINNKANGPGNAISVIIKSEQLTECFTEFGQRGLPAEQVATRLVKQVQRYLEARVPVGSYLADQLLLPLALAGSGNFVTVKPSLHTTTNMAVIEQFMDVHFTTEELDSDVWKISLAK